MPNPIKLVAIPVAFVIAFVVHLAGYIVIVPLFAAKAALDYVKKEVV